jgi:hydroxyacyl-ACP dehydratase HTD2-like protein with hotdog domain
MICPLIKLCMCGCNSSLVVTIKHLTIDFLDHQVLYSGRIKKTTSLNKCYRYLESLLPHKTSRSCFFIFPHQKFVQPLSFDLVLWKSRCMCLHGDIRMEDRLQCKERGEDIAVCHIVFIQCIHSCTGKTYTREYFMCVCVYTHTHIYAHAHPPPPHTHTHKVISQKVMPVFSFHAPESFFYHCTKPCSFIASARTWQLWCSRQW